MQFADQELVERLTSPWSGRLLSSREQAIALGLLWRDYGEPNGIHFPPELLAGAEARVRARGLPVSLESLAPAILAGLPAAGGSQPSARRLRRWGNRGHEADLADVRREVENLARRLKDYKARAREIAELRVRQINAKLDDEPT